MEKNEAPDVPEILLPYLNEISERLWSGHAAVMVGAGFSKNAKPNGTSCKGFPDWNQLGDVFFEKTYGTKPEGREKYLNVLKLADEMQAALGRPALDKLLRDVIPDCEYKPSPLHVKLLDLPWTDVFTTNYDTLLERACSSITSQKYDVVVNKEDLVYSEKPRIIKLHGSFPSERPFIITEEDYRRYPKQYAPFVNTVQQALLEDTLCVIGFSGDDPNFLQWIGWIRDNLGADNSPKIYLVGVLSLSVAQKKLLEQRNIVPIDMSECNGINGDHSKGIDLFLEVLSWGKLKDNKQDWPPKELVKVSRPDTSSDMNDQFINVLEQWKVYRESYPGWVIMPEELRNSLWYATEPWTRFYGFIKFLPEQLEIDFSYELLWRMERCLCPIFNQQISYFENVLVKHFDFVAGNDGGGANIDLNTEDKFKYINIYLSVMRFYREEGCFEKWEKEKENIQSITGLMTPMQEACYCYEKSLCAIFRLNIDEIRTELNLWKINNSLPFLEAKRGILYAEIGDLVEADRILQKSLKTIRGQLNLKPITTDYTLVSQESYILVLLQSVQMSEAIIKGEWGDFDSIPEKYSERLNALRQYKCDPWDEMKTFSKILSTKKGSQEIRKETYNFDIGIVSMRMFASIGNKALLTAYAFLRFSEDAGTPFRLPGINLDEKRARGALSSIAKYSSYWAGVTLIRIGDGKNVDFLFGRKYLAKSSIFKNDELIIMLLESIRTSFSEIKDKGRLFKESFGAVLASVVPEIMSRLCCKCSYKIKLLLLDFLAGVYSFERKGNFNSITNLTRRLLNSFSIKERWDLIPRILEFQILTNLTSKESYDFSHPILSLEIDGDVINRLERIELDERIVSRYFEYGNSDDVRVRKLCIIALSKLLDWDLLSQKQVLKFQDVLWAKIDESGLPCNTGYYRFGLLDLPHSNKELLQGWVKKCILDMSFPVQLTREEKGWQQIGGNIPLCTEIIGASSRIEWSNEEFIRLFTKIEKWWDADNKYLDENDDQSESGFPTLRREIVTRFGALIDALVVFLKPDRRNNIDEDIESRIKKLILGIKSSGLPTLSLEMVCMDLFPVCEREFVEKIRCLLSSSSEDLIVDSLNAIHIYLDEMIKGGIDETLEKVLECLAYAVMWRHEDVVVYALQLIETIVNVHAEVFSGDFEKMVLCALRHIVDGTVYSESDDEYAKMLLTRKTTASLAYKLSTIYDERSEQLPEAIELWKMVCQSEDEFAEIRNQWVVFD